MPHMHAVASKQASAIIRLRAVGCAGGCAVEATVGWFVSVRIGLRWWLVLVVSCVVVS